MHVGACEGADYGVCFGEMALQLGSGEVDFNMSEFGVSVLLIVFGLMIMFVFMVMIV